MTSAVGLERPLSIAPHASETHRDRPTAVFPGQTERANVRRIVIPEPAMRVGDLDLSDCGDCPLLAGLSDEQKLERVKNDRMIARCLSQRKASIMNLSRPRKRARCVELDNTQGLEDVAG